MNRSGIGYAGPGILGADGRPVEANYGWNPGGFGCTGDCDGCWARSLGKRQRSNCYKCATFKVHLHEDRLAQLTPRQKPKLVLANFTCDAFDGARPSRDIVAMLAAAEAAPQHTYVWLTKRPDVMARMFSRGGVDPRWYLGCTIRDQADADAKLPTFLAIPGNLWLSLEPLRGPLRLPSAALKLTCIKCGAQGHQGDYDFDDEDGFHYRNWDTECGATRGIKGLIIGHDNRKGAPGTDTLDHIRGCRAQCMDAGIPSFVKQAWVDGKLLHASKPAEYALYPEDLRGGRLPWSAPGGA